MPKSGTLDTYICVINPRHTARVPWVHLHTLLGLVGSRTLSSESTTASFNKNFCLSPVRLLPSPFPLLGPLRMPFEPIPPALPMSFPQRQVIGSSCCPPAGGCGFPALPTPSRADPCGPGSPPPTIAPPLPVHSAPPPCHQTSPVLPPHHPISNTFALPAYPPFRRMEVLLQHCT